MIPDSTWQPSPANYTIGIGILAFLLIFIVQTNTNYEEIFYPFSCCSSGDHFR